MLTRLLRLVVLALVTSSCAEGQGEALFEQAASPGRARAPAASTHRAPPGTPVTIRVEARDGTSIVGRRVVVVDALGQRHESTSDARGELLLDDVVAPFDVAVPGVSGPARTAPWVVLGLARPRARIRTAEVASPGTGGERLRSTLRLGVLVPGEGARVIEVVTRGAGGEGHARVDVPPGEARGVVAVDHGFGGAAGAEAVDVDVLVTDDARSWFRHGRMRALAVRAGEPRDLGMIETSAIGSEMVSATVTSALSPAYEQGVGLSVDVGGRPLFGVERRGADLTVALPLVAGASFATWAWAERGANGTGELHAGSRAWRTRPLAERSVALTLETPLASERPTPGGVVPASTDAIVWARDDHGVAHVATLAVSSTSPPRTLFHVQTDAPEVARSRLAALGVGWPSSGAYVLDVADQVGVDMGDVTADVPPLAASGASTSRRIAFDVAP